MVMNVSADEQIAQTIRGLVEEARRAAEGAARVDNLYDLQPAHISESIPGYVLHEIIHRGGQGTVYRATQAATGRLVALKIMHDRPMQRAEDIIRFRREVEILTELRHPGIVALYDGKVEGGRPCLVMELIHGKRLDEYVQENSLGADECLHLFVGLCDAVGEAHVRGVVHRDLKPSNILVDPDGRPHVLDFGLAKLLAAEPGSGNPDLTETGQFVGSLMWAAPEQAGGEGDKVDVRTDVHALGLILFEALTGKHPFGVSGPVTKALDGIMHDEAARPSSIVHGLNDEIDTLVLKCLQKDRDRRYQSAKDLGADIQRYLHGDAIDAKRDSTWYVLSKTARRHRWLVGGGLAAAFVAVVYGITVTALLQRATNAERDAEAQRAEAVRKYDLARESLEFLVHEVSEELASVGPARDARRRILQGAYARLQGLLSERSDDVVLNEDVARTHLQLGDIAITIGEVAAAEEHFKAALAVLDELAALDASGRVLARLHALTLIRLGDAYKDRGDLANTEASYNASHVLIEQAVESDSRSAAAFSDLAWSASRRGWVQLQLGNQEQAKALYEEQLTIAQEYVAEFPESDDALFALFMSYRNLAEASNQDQNSESAAEWNSASLPIGQQLLARAPDNPMYARRVAAAYFANARIEFANDHLDLGEAHLESAEALLGRLLSNDPEVIETQRSVATYRLELGHQASRDGVWPAAAEHYSAAVTWLGDLVNSGDESLDSRRRYLRAAYGAALACYQNGDLDESREHSETVLEIVQSMLDAGTVDQNTVKFYADFLRLVGRRVVPDLTVAISTLDDLLSQLDHPMPMTRLAVARANCSIERWGIGATEYATVLPEVSGDLRESQLAKFESELQVCAKMAE